MAVDKTYKHAGIITVHDAQGKKSLELNVTNTRNDDKHCVWIKLPGKVEINYFKLPRKMTKYEIANFLLKEEDNKVGYIQTFLTAVAEANNPSATKATKKAASTEKKVEAVKKIKATAAKKPAATKVTKKEPTPAPAGDDNATPIPEELLG